MSQAFSFQQHKKLCLLPASASVSVSDPASEPKIGGETDDSGKVGPTGPSLQTSLLRLCYHPGLLTSAFETGVAGGALKFEALILKLFLDIPNSIFHGF